MSEVNPFAGADPIEEENLGNYEGDESSGGFQIPQAVVDANTESEESAPEPEPETAAEAEPEPEGEVSDEADEGSEPESAEEPEAAAEEPEPEPEAEKKPDIRIPKARLDSETAKRRAAENRAKQLEAELAQAKGEAAVPGSTPQIELDLGDNAKTMFDSVLDGDLDKANSIFNDTLKSVAEKAAAVAAETATATSTQKIEQQQQAATLDQVIDRIEDTYEQFRPGTEAYSEDFVSEAVALRAGYETQGYSPADAMQKAVDVVVKMNGLDAPAEPPPPVEPEAKKPTTNREVERNLKLKEQQPPSLPSGETSGEQDSEVSILTEDDFDALPEATIRRLRGDLV